MARQAGQRGSGPVSPRLAFCSQEPHHTCQTRAERSGTRRFAGQRQKEYAKDQRQEMARAFTQYNLTRKNEEFMFQLNKQLDAQGADPAKKPAMLEETIKALQEGQKSGQTARGLFGTPTQRAHALLHPEPTEKAQTQTSLKLMALAGVEPAT